MKTTNKETESKPVSSNIIYYKSVVYPMLKSYLDDRAEEEYLDYPPLYPSNQISAVIILPYSFVDTYGSETGKQAMIVKTSLGDRLPASPLNAFSLSQLKEIFKFIERVIGISEK